MIAREYLVRIILDLDIDHTLCLATPVPLSVVFQRERTFREIRGISYLIESLLVLGHHVIVLYVGESRPEILTD